MDFIKKNQNGVTVRIRLSPNAKREGIEGLYSDADSLCFLKVAVNAPPVNGKANKALVALLSKLWKIPKSSFKISCGTTDRNKVLAIDGIDADAMNRICLEVEKCLK